MSARNENERTSCFTMGLMGFIGLVTCLVGIWVPAIYIDDMANANSGGAGAGATLAAMFICSPAALIIGPICGIVGYLIVRWFGKRRGNDTDNPVWGYLGAGVMGFVVGALPFVVLQLLDWLNIEGF